MRYSVPQFLETEDTVVGPLTIRQSLYLGFAAITGFLSIMVFTVFWAMILTLPVFIICVVLAFYKPDGRPVLTYVLSFFNFVFRPKLYVWKREPEGFIVKRGIKKETYKEAQNTEFKVVSRNRLQELAWILDTKEVIDAEGDEEREE